MLAIPAPTLVVHREEWPDTDFEIPEGDAIVVASDAESDQEDGEEDWDAEMNLGPTGGAKVSLPARRSVSFSTAPVVSHPSGSLAPSVSIHLPLKESTSSTIDGDDDDDDDEGASTIKLTTRPPIPPRTPPPKNLDDDLESAFALPSDLSHLSLRPLHHRSSKTSLEWGEKDHTSSSTSSSDAYSSLGFGLTASPSSNGTSASQPETETEDDDDEGLLEGLVLPSGLFESGKGGKELARILDMKKKLPVVDERGKLPTPDQEEDFEMGLIIVDDVDLSPSRLLQNQKKQSNLMTRSKSMPPRAVAAARPPSRLRGELEPADGNVADPRLSQSALQPAARIRTSTRSPTLLRPRPPSRSQTTSALSSISSASTSARPDIPLPPPSALPPPRPQTSIALRGQKSHGVLKPSGTTGRRALARKASLSTLMDAQGDSKAAGSSSDLRSAPILPTGTLPARYGDSTAASRAKIQSHFQSSSRLQVAEHKVPPTRPSTPSANPAALRLTMPTSSSRLKSRPAISSVFPSSSTPSLPPNPSPTPRTISPLPRPKSRLNTQTQQPPPITQTGPKLLRRPKRARVYGDGTELDGIEDLPTDRDKERKYRVTPKFPPNRATPPVLSTSPKDKNYTIGRRAGRADGSIGHSPEPLRLIPGIPGSQTMRHKSHKVPDSPTRRRRGPAPQPNATRRKPTLIRNLGGAGTAKVVGDMKWNPQTMKWEGNEQVLRDFDAAVGTSTRPALITHLTGSSIGSPVSSFAGGARIVGNMIFDPARMCWISRLPPEEDEPDVFADLADDEEDGDGWETKGGTIRASAVTSTPARTPESREETPSPARSRHSRALSESGSERGGETPRDPVAFVDAQLAEASRTAELRHRAEMKGWIKAPSSTGLRTRTLEDIDQDKAYLFDIRAVATRNYSVS